MAAEYDETRVWTSISDCLIQNRCWICLTPFRRGKTRKVFMMQDIVDHFEKRRQFKELVDSTLAADAAAAAVAAEASTSASVTATADDATSTEQSKTTEEAASSTDTGTSTAPAAVEAAGSEASAAPAATTATASAGAAADTASNPQQQPGQHHVVPSFSTSDVEAVEGFVHMKRTWERYLKLMEGGGEKAQARLTKELKDCDVDLWMSGLACCNSTLCSAVYKCLKPPADGEEVAGAAGGKKSKVRNYIANMKNCPPGCGCDNPWPFMGNNVVSESSTTASISMPPVGQQPPTSVNAAANVSDADGDGAGAAPPFPLKAPSEAAPTAPAAAAAAAAPAAAPAAAAPMVGMFGKPMVRQKKA